VLAHLAQHGVVTQLVDLAAQFSGGAPGPEIGILAATNRAVQEALALSRAATE
jgi:hypothetical protein